MKTKVTSILRAKTQAAVRIDRDLGQLNELAVERTYANPMNLPRRIYSDLLDRLTQRRRPTPDTRVRVSNLTRQTLLASNVVVADEAAKRRKGLLGRELLSPGEGLWILPCEAVHTFGMQFPIDVVYLDRSHRIIKVSSNVLPRRLSVCVSAHSVIELASGTIRDTQTRPGDSLNLESYI